MEEYKVLRTFEFNGWEIEVVDDKSLDVIDRKGSAKITSPRGDVLDLYFSNELDEVFSKPTGWLVSALIDARDHMKWINRNEA